jgi:hypothetical protein
MGAFLSQCRKATCDVIPDKKVMLDIVDRIAMFEEMLQCGQKLSPEMEKERKKLEPVIREIEKAKDKITPLTPML